MSKSNRFCFVLFLGTVFLGASFASAATEEVKTLTKNLSPAKLYFSKSLVNDRVARPVDQNQPVNENIMDTPITGTTHLQGNIKSSLMPNSEAGQIRILLKAHSTSKTTGQHWPVIIHDQSAGKLVGSIDIVLNGLKFSTEREKAAADLHVTSQNVQSQIGSSRWVLAIAKSKIRDAQPAANLQAEDLAEKQIRNQLQKQVQQVLRQAKEQLDAHLIKPLSRSGMKPTHLQFQTTNDWLVLTANWSKTTDSTKPDTSGFEPTAQLVTVLPESTCLEVYNGLTGKDLKTLAQLDSTLSELNLPKSWNQKTPLKLLKKEKRNGHLIFQWGYAK